MKSLVLILSLLFVLFFVSCTVKLTSKSSKPLPPGQAKKVAGAQSASSFAPGHNKNWVFFIWPASVILFGASCVTHLYVLCFIVQTSSSFKHHSSFLKIFRRIERPRKARLVRCSSPLERLGEVFSGKILCAFCAFFANFAVPKN